MFGLASFPQRQLGILECPDCFPNNSYKSYWNAFFQCSSNMLVAGAGFFARISQSPCTQWLPMPLAVCLLILLLLLLGSFHSLHYSNSD